MDTQRSCTNDSSVNQTAPVKSNRYRCPYHDVWLTLRVVGGNLGVAVFHFWQCPHETPQVGGNSKSRCQFCKPCKSGNRITKRELR